MGVGSATAQFLMEAAQRGVRFDRTATIGRQTLFVAPRDVERLIARHRLGLASARDPAVRRRLREEPGLLDPMLAALGATEVTSIDASDYEGATLVHDLNRPIPDELERRFSLVFDGGSLEHIFNVPVAISSYMRMVEVGGHLIIHTMANNYLGHGFYQFSPEFFFRVLGPANGFEVERVVVVENDIAWRTILGVPIPIETAGPWYEVVDPADARARVVLQNSRPVVIQVQARRTADVAPFLSAPQQSDYVAVWAAPESADGAGATAAMRARLAARLTSTNQTKWPRCASVCGSGGRNSSRPSPTMPRRPNRSTDGWSRPTIDRSHSMPA